MCVRINGVRKKVKEIQINVTERVSVSFAFGSSCNRTILSRLSSMVQNIRQQIYND